MRKQWHYQKKNLLLVPLTVLAAMALAGCAGSQQAVKTQDGDGKSVANEGSASENDWVSLLGDGKSVECTVPGGETATKISAEGKKYRTESLIDGKKHLSVSDGEMLWTWVEGEKQGMKMEFSCMDDIRATIPEDGGPAPEYAASPEEALGDRPGIACSESGPVDVSVPADVSFSDQCALLKGQLRMMEQVKGKVPAVPDMKQIPESVRRTMEQQQ